MNIQNQIILIIDDNVTNIDVLVGTLKAHGFETVTARNGTMGIKRAKFSQPDLILLDIKMPAMDGYEVCELMKADERTKNIPVIFISALNETFNKVKAFAVGGVDYITKPFQKEEVLARVQTHLMLQSQKQQLMQLNQEKDEFLSIASHDLKNPLNAIFGCLQIVEMSIETEEFSSKAEVIEYVNKMHSTILLMLELIDKLLNVNAIESGKIQLNLQDENILLLLKWVVEEYSQKATVKDITLHFSADKGNYLAHIDVNMVREILDNLISNAIKYSPFGKNVYVHIFATQEGNVCCEIQDEGPGLSSEDQTKLFQKFSRLSPQTTNKESSTGLGLFIVKKLVTAMGGKVWCESELGKGTKFGVEFMPADGNDENCEL